MRILNRQVIGLLIVFTLPFLFTVQGCKKDDEGNDNNQNNQTSTTYTGTLSVYYLTQVPPMYAEETMDVFIDEKGMVTIASGGFEYSGDMVVDNSKIERSGGWIMTPTGSLISQNGEPWVKIDANIVLVDDVQRVYEKDDQGEWQLVYEVTFPLFAGSDIAFSLNDAVENELGAKIEISDEMGGITWILLLSKNII
jgi:hypothetical protein